MRPGNTLEAKLAAIDAAEASEPGFFLLKPKVKALLGVGDTTVEGLFSSETIDSVIVGNRRAGLRPSVFALMRERVRASYAPDGTPLKVRQPRSMFKKQPRARTPAELNGLAKANERRRREATARRSAAKAHRAAKEPTSEPA